MLKVTITGDKCGGKTFLASIVVKALSDVGYEILSDEPVEIKNMDDIETRTVVVRSDSQFVPRTVGVYSIGEFPLHRL